MQKTSLKQTLESTDLESEWFWNAKRKIHPGAIVLKVYVVKNLINQEKST